MILMSTIRSSRYADNMFRKLFVFLGCVCFFGCHPDMSGDVVPVYTTSQISLRIKQAASDEITTRAFDDSGIADLHILVYDNKNQQIGHQYVTGNSTTMQVRCGTGCTIFAIANTGNPTLFNGTVASDITKLRAMVTNEITLVDGIKTNDHLLMSGSLNNVTIVAGSSPQVISGLTVERIAAKIVMNVTAATGYTITGYAIKNLPSKSYLIARPNANESSTGDLAIGDDAATAWFDTPVTNSSSIANLNFYLYENRKGDRVSVKGGVGTPTNQQEKAKYAPANATYIEVYASGYGYNSTYRIYLGADNARNYNIKRNSSYTYNVRILSATETDTRISKVAFPSNCYILPPGKSIVFPVSRANEDGVVRIPNLGSGWITELLWTDNSLGMKADGSSIIKSLTAQGDGTIKVESGSGEGNAVVVAKVGGVIVWSWHIWVTSYDPSVTNLAYNNGTVTTTFMDRNLGTKNNTVQNIGSLGLLYQWGRKDPFPGASTLTGTTSASIYNASGTKLKEGGSTATGVKKVAVAVSNNFNNSIQNPLTFYYNAYSPYDWYSNSSTKNDNLWNSTGNSKTVYDPCPDGWRVPVSGSGTSSVWYKTKVTTTTSNYLVSSFTNGWNFVNAGYNLGWYPAAGKRLYNSGTLSAVGTQGYCWSSRVNGTNVYSFYLKKSSINPSNLGVYRSEGYNVRCVKE